MSTTTTTNTMTSSPIFRIFNGTERVSTAVVVGPRSQPTNFLQIKPARKLFASQAEWIASVTATLPPTAFFTVTREDKPTPKPWSEMTEAERAAYQKQYHERAVQRRIAREKAKAAKMIAMKAAENKTIRAIRSLYDTYGISDTLSMKGNRMCKNPSLFVLWKGNIMPVYFNRKTGKALIALTNHSATPDFGELENVSFFFKTNKSTGVMRRVRPDLTTPNPNDKNILYLCNNLAAFPPDDCVAKLTAKGFKVKMMTMTTRLPYQIVEEYKHDPVYFEIMRGPWGYGAKGAVTTFKNLEDKDKYSSSMHIDAWLAKFAVSSAPAAAPTPAV